jgi:hypothetical protein
MRMIEYLVGRRIQLSSPFPPQECTRRIDAAAPSTFSMASGVVGGARAGRLWLRYRSSPFSATSGAPRLVGRMEPAGTGSSLRLRYRAPAGTPFFFLWWFIMFSLIFLAVAPNIRWAPDISVMERFGVGAVYFAIMFGGPAMMWWMATRTAEVDLEELLKFLAESVKAWPVQGA